VSEGGNNCEVRITTQTRQLPRLNVNVSERALIIRNASGRAKLIDFALDDQRHKRRVDKLMNVFEEEG
jgi:hypothetical protein